MARIADSFLNALIVTAVLGWLIAVAPVEARSLEPARAPEDCGLYAYRAIITEVYDGDTVTADVDLGFKTWRRDERLRLYGIDAPEVRGAERSEGLSARDALRRRVLGEDVVICTIKDKTGKYGRYLAEIFLDGENINDWLVAEGYAEPYGDVALSSVGATGGQARFERAPLPDTDD
ncbi:MAG: thermonuclease family protein [Pseudomonadota bacterium]